MRGTISEFVVLVLSLIVAMTIANRIADWIIADGGNHPILVKLIMGILIAGWAAVPHTILRQRRIRRQAADSSL